MTDTQFMVIIGTIYISHANKEEINGIIGAVLLICAALKGLGWL